MLVGGDVGQDNYEAADIDAAADNANDSSASNVIDNGVLLPHKHRPFQGTLRCL